MPLTRECRDWSWRKGCELSPLLSGLGEETQSIALTSRGAGEGGSGGGTSQAPGTASAVTFTIVYVEEEEEEEQSAPLIRALLLLVSHPVSCPSSVCLVWMYLSLRRRAEDENRAEEEENKGRGSSSTLEVPY